MSLVPAIFRMFKGVGLTREEWRRSGYSADDIKAATLKLVRFELEQHVPPMDEWPPYATMPKCGYCDGTGLVLRFDVIDRLGQSITQGEPCRCSKGARFMPKTQTESDFTQAGKTAKPKTFTRFGDR